MPEIEATEQIKQLRLAVGSLLDIVSEIAEVVGGDDEWKNVVRGAIENHRIELGFTR